MSITVEDLAANIETVLASLGDEKMYTCLHLVGSTGKWLSRLNIT